VHDLVKLDEPRGDGVNGGVEWLSAGEVFAEEFREATVREFGENGGWLLLSIRHYGWRVYYDLARTLAREQDQPLDDRQAIAFQIVRDLQVQSYLYAIAEQLARLVRACRAHESGTERFFDAFVPFGYVGKLVSDAQSLSREELGVLIREPVTIQEAKLAYPAPARGWDDDEVQEAVEEARRTIDDLYTNLQELKQLTDTPTMGVTESEITPHPLREVDNAFRHGLRVFFSDALPVDRGFRALGEITKRTPFAVELHLSEREPMFGTLYCDHDRTAHHIRVLAVISLRVLQLCHGFLRAQVHKTSAGALFMPLLARELPPIESQE